MTDRVLLVDDDPNILSALQRQLRNECSAEVDVTTRPERALELLSEKGPYALVISDMRMPGKDGVQLLGEIKVLAPNTVRMMLTGNMDLQTAVNAINTGSIFRFLNKPCSLDILSKAITDGLQQYHLITAEKELLNKTMVGVVKMLMEFLSIIDPISFGETSTLREPLGRISKALNLSNSWEIDLAALLSTIGYIAIPSVVLTKLHAGEGFSEKESKILRETPKIGHHLLAHIPRFEGVSKAVLYLNKNFDGSGFPEDEILGQEIPLASRLIRIVRDFQKLQSDAKSPLESIKEMEARVGFYDSDLLSLVSSLLAPKEAPKPKIDTRFKIKPRQFCVGQTVLSNIETVDGVLIIKSGTLISETILAKLTNYANLIGLDEEIYVDNIVPPEKTD